MVELKGDNTEQKEFNKRLEADVIELKARASRADEELVDGKRER